MVHKADQKFKLIAGLGNPGGRYEMTYHNAGALFVRYLLSEEENAAAGENPLPPMKQHKTFMECERNGVRFALTALPMNASGRAIRGALSYFKIAPSALLLAHDDSDLPVGTFRISRGRGSAGHHGVDSVIQELGTTEFSRIRFGIRHSDEKADEFVLLRMPESHASLLYGTFRSARTKLMLNENVP